MTQKAVKGQAIADHLADNPVDDYQSIGWEFPDEDIMAISTCEDEKTWRMYFDEASNVIGNGVGAVIIFPDGQHFPVAIKLMFPSSNNIAEYEACIAGLMRAIDLELDELQVFGDSSLIIFQTSGDWKTKDPKLIPYHEHLETLMKRFKSVTFTHLPRTENRFADALATLASMIQMSSQPKLKPVVIENRDEPAYCNHIEEEASGKPWYHDIEQYKRNQQYPLHALDNDKKTIRRMSASYFLDGNILYKRSHDNTLLRCVDSEEARRSWWKFTKALVELTIVVICLQGKL